jgi:protein TonB
MRSPWFLTISLALHLTVLVYFSAGDGRQSLPPIAVTILPIEAAEQGGNQPLGDDNGVDQSRHKAAKKSPAQFVPLEQRSTDTETASEAPNHPSVVEVSAKSSEASIVQAVATSGVESAASGIGSGPAGGSGNGLSGNGSANGVGRDSPARAVITAPARYSDTPKPAYPDTARREGREGRVLLRVLIDEQGETKTVEVSRSSGSDALDHAATSAIKRWRFHPAKSGERSIESWVNVPIDFRLTDTRN